MRTFLIFAALIVSGIGFARLTSKRVEVDIRDGTEVSGHLESERIPAKVYLILSHFSERYELSVGDEKVSLLRGVDGELVGNVSVDPASAVVSLKVSYAGQALEDGQRFFAKLVVEAEGEETFIHIFDADGDIDEFVELPF